MTRHSVGMNSTFDHSTYQHGSLATWRLLASSDGTRGRKGGMKQYLVRIELRKDGKFVVKKFWGKADGQRLSELASQDVGVYDDYASARFWAYRVVREKLDGKYWHDYAKQVELVDA